MMPLQVFEKHPEADAYRVGGFYSPYCLVSKDKRFTEAELAAGYWLSMSGIFYGSGKAERIRRATIERFATLPHFDA